MSDELAPDWISLAGFRFPVIDGEPRIPPIAGAEEPEAEEQDTPPDDPTPDDGDTEVEPTEDESAEDVDWQKRYSDLQPEYTRTTQRVKELEALEQWKPLIDDLNHPEKRRDALNWLLQQEGLELPDEVEEAIEDGDDDLEFRDPRVDEILQQQEQRDMEAAFGEFEKHVDSLLTESELQLTGRERRALINECIEEGFNQEATKKVVAGWAAEKQSEHDALIKAYVEGKRKQPAAPVKRGASGTEHVPLDSEKARQRAALEVANEAFAD